MATSRFAPYNEPTIDGVIAAGRALHVSQDKMSFKEAVSDGISEDKVIIQYYDIITKYHHAIRPMMRDYVLTEEDLYRYKFKPNLFCYDKFGTPELTSSLLYMNNMPSSLSFNRSNISIFPDNIIDIVKELMVINDRELKRNRINLNS